VNRILLVEDDPEICEIIQFYILEHENYELTIAHSGEEALPLMKKCGYDLILLDIMLPGVDGLQLCHEFRRLTDCPIIFISCINDDQTIIDGLGMGADDYLIKPFRANVLMARIEANLRRCRMQQQRMEQLIAGELKVDMCKHRVQKAGREIALSPTEYELLVYLMQHPGVFVSFEEIYWAVWQRPSLGDMRALFVHISHLRQKIEDQPAQPAYIRTHMRGGYVFAGPD